MEDEMTFTADQDTGMYVPNDTPRSDDPTDPTGVVATIVASVTALVAIAVAFGVPLAEEQQAALLSAVAVIAPVAAMYWVRLKAWRPSTVGALVEKTAAKADEAMVMQALQIMDHQDSI